MPFENSTWRPPTNEEVQNAVQAMHKLVDGAAPIRNDTTYNYDVDVPPLLGDPEGYTWHEVRKISDHLLLEHLLDGESIDYFRVFHHAADLTRTTGLKIPDASSTEWEAAIPIIIQGMQYVSEEQAIELARMTHGAIVAGCDAARRLRARGFTIDLYASNFRMEPSEYERLCCLIVQETRARTGRLFYFLTDMLDQFWWPEFERYVTSLNTNTSPGKSAASIPLGYLYNLSVKVMSENQLGHVKAATTDQEYFELISDICALERVEQYNWAEIALPSGNRLLELTSDLGKLQFAFTLPQLDERQIVPTLRAGFSWIDADVEGKLGWTLEGALRFYEAFQSDLRSKGAVMIPKASMKSKAALPSAEFDALWCTFVHAPASANASFSQPFAALTANAQFKPLIGLDADRAFVGLRSISAGGWYEAVATALRTAGVKDTDDRIGVAFEPFVRNRLAMYGKVHHGTFRTPDANGDVDVALETDSEILLFELKKKALTRAAMAGDTVKVLLDLIQSVVKAQSQLAKIEYVLRKDDGITLSGTGRLNLKGRAVKRIVLSWHDYGVFHDHGFLSNFLRQMMPARMTPTDGAKEEDVRKINEQLQDLEFWEQKLLDSPGRPGKVAFQNAFFYSIGQLLNITQDCNTTSEFLRHITFNEYVVSAALDFYVEYGRWLRFMLPTLQGQQGSSP